MTVTDRTTTLVPVTLSVQRHFDHPSSEVFNAYADIERRVQWLVAAEDTISYASSDFSVGGSDHFVLVRGHHPGRTGVIRYEHVVEAEAAIFTQRLTESDGRLLAISLVSWSISTEGAETVLSIADQTTSVVGSRPIEGARYRYETMLDRLEKHLSSQL